jgi:hypothetical protein
MVSTNLQARSDIKRTLEWLWYYIQVEEYGNAKNASDMLRDTLLKYYVTRGVSANHFYDLFEELNFDILYSTNNHFKKQIIFDQVLKIVKEIQTSTKDPLLRLQEIYDDIRHLYYNIDKYNVAELIDCFDEINNLKEEMGKIGGPVYNYYTLMMEKLGTCESSMLRVNQVRLTDGLFQQLEGTFAEFFKSVHKVITPPVRLEVARSEIYDQVQRGVPIGELVEATGHAEEDLRLMLQSESMARSAAEEAKAKKEEEPDDGE